MSEKHPGGQMSGDYYDSCGYFDNEGNLIYSPICPNCNRPVSSHEMFNPPRCPVIRLGFPSTAVWPDEAIISYCQAQ